MIGLPGDATEAKAQLRSHVPAILCTTMVFLIGSVLVAAASAGRLSYTVVDTAQVRCYDNNTEIEYPKPSGDCFGQDAQYIGNEPAYKDNGDGTVTDLNTGLMWQSDPGEKMTFKQAVAGASKCRIAGYADWRLPTIKELYSLILFSGEDIDPRAGSTSGLNPFIDTAYFAFVYGDPAKGERVIDSQMATATKYVSTTMRGNETMFGVNFADGRIKGYPTGSHRPGGRAKRYYVFYVRGNPEYGKNDFLDNGDGTITDRATGLTWAKLDSGHLKGGENKDGKMNWEQALRWAEDLEYAGHSDWRLPNAKELQSIVDYTRSPDTTQSAAIDPVFDVTPIRDAQGEVNYPFYWSSTTHKRMGGGEAACYVAFGRSQGWMGGTLMDVHGAGSQRSDPKAGDPAQFPRGRGPQGDVIGIYNMVRPVRGGEASIRRNGPELAPKRTGRRMGRGGMGPQWGMGPQPGLGGAGPQAGFRPPKHPLNAALDANGDDVISAEEIENAVAALKKLDKNGDGKLTSDELRPEGGPGFDGVGRGGFGQGGFGGPRRGGSGRGRPGAAGPGGASERPQWPR